MINPLTPPPILQRHPLDRVSRRLRLAGLSLVTSPILGAYFLGHGGGFSPFFCPVLKVTGVPCPGCGMTRSFVALARGDFDGAIAFHLFGPLVFTACFGIAIHLSLELYTGQKIRYPALANWLQRRQVTLLVLIALLTYHGLRLWGLAQSGELAASIAAAPLHRLFSGL
ncbi:DUF2752 domain-containing protein [Spirulina major CS-329]|uniref:DUF2752 domain-containing protein n=1 Tax=Spirulina TaxID=1154 RepID=UPI00232AE148|nr:MULTISPECIES: DUF2752 domain-containing protein [Spirulina]MDB9493953.1 DUF2752 domain-containing protein [Spirulina subsalsa CS-330]MDB9503712.1 DUF2752 domain-containing protein [Spirulina major CS-329]